MDYKGLTIQFDGDASKLLAVLRQIDSEASATQTGLSRVAAALKLDPTNQSLYNAQTRLLSGSLRDEEASLASLRREYERYKKEEPAKQAKALSDAEQKAALAIQERQRALESEYGRSAQYLTEYQQNAQALKLIGEHADTSSTRVSWLKKETDKYTERLDALRSQYEATASGGGEYGKHLTELQEEIAITEAKIKGYRKELEATARSSFFNANPFGRAIVGAEQFGQSLSRLGSYLTNVLGLRLTMFEGAIALGFGRSVIDEVENYTNALSQVGGYLDITGEKLENMGNLALYWGKETQFSATEAADAMSELAKGGMTDAQIQAGALEATMQLAAAGGISMADAATVAVNAIKVFGLSAEDATEVADALAGAANKSTAEISDLSSSFRYVSGWAGLADYSINDVAGALGLLADYGLTGQIAGTGLRNVLQRLAAPTGKAAELMEQYGLQVYDAEGKMKDIVTIVDDLNTAFADLDDETRNGVLNTIFGARGLPAAVALMEAGTDQLQDYISATEREGYALEMMQARMGDIGWALEYLRGEFETFKVSIGKALEPYIIDVANTIEGMLSEFNSMDVEKQRDLVFTVMKIAAAGPGVMALGVALKIVGGAFIGLSRAAAGFSELVISLGEGKTILASLGAGISELTGGAVAASGAMFGLFSAVALVVGALGAWQWHKYTQEQKKAQERTERFENSTRGLLDTLDDIHTGTMIHELELFSDSIRTTTGDIDDMIEAQSNLVDAISERNSDAQTSIDELERARRIIMLYGTSVDDLTQQQLGDLNWALGVVNESLGTNYQYSSDLKKIYDENGESIEGLIGHIDDLILAKEREIQAEAIQANMRDLYQAQSKWMAKRAELQEKYREQTEKVAEAEQRMRDAEANRDYSGGEGDVAFAAAQSEYNEAVLEQQRLRDEIINTNREIHSTNVALEEYANQLAAVLDTPLSDAEKLTKALEILSGTGDEIGESISGFLQGIVDFPDDGIDTIDQLGSALADAGFNMESLARLTQDELAAMLESSTSAQDFIDKLVEWSSASEQAKASADELDGTEATITVTTDTTEGQQGVDDFRNSIEFEPPAPVPIDADASQAIEQSDTAQQAIDNIDDEHNTEISASATEFFLTMDSVNRELLNLPSRRTVYIDLVRNGPAMRDGGMLYRHADGFITNHSLYSGNHVIGEAGIEAVLPLNNRAATQPLVDAIADGVSSRIGGGNQYNLYINDARVNDDPAIRSAFIDLMGAVNRKGMQTNAAR